MTTETNDGGPAFPSPVDPHKLDDKGMTLRDYFAAKAMAAEIAAGKDMGGMRGYDGWRDEFAREAYRYADAMLRARKDQP